MPQLISHSQLLLANRQALANGTLLAQAVEQGLAPSRCRYRLGQFRCAIGVVLDFEVAPSQQSKSIATLLEICQLFSEPDKAGKLQAAHDHWVHEIVRQNEGRGIISDLTAARNAYLALLQEEPTSGQ